MYYHFTTPILNLKKSDINNMLQKMWSTDELKEVIIENAIILMT